MNKIENYQQIQDILIRIKDYKEGFITNFFIGEERCNFLINNKKLLFFNFEKCSFILFKNDDFYHLYYLSVNSQQLSIALKDLIKMYPEITFVTDIVGQETIVTELSKSFEQCGFEKYSKLFRMNRSKAEEQYEALDPRVEFASPEWANQIKSLLDVHFDKYCEQIPFMEEIEQWIKYKRIIGIFENDKIIGFVIFEINGMTSHLRYWFVDPNHRNKKIGSALLKRFFYECRNTKKELFWVITHNENAIVRYEHYGFKAEPLFDQVLIKRN
jgi:GNAT superfamily N-acetyltransferase